MEKIIKTAMGVGNTAMGVENTGTYPIRDAEKLASAINNLANAIDRLNEQPEEKYHYLNGNEPIKDKETIEFMEGLPERVWEDTPEETEEWEEKFNKKYPCLLDGHEGSDDLDVTDEIIAFIKQLLKEREKKAREEGYENCMDDIWEEARGLRGWTEHDGSVSSADVEAGLREAYLNIEKKSSKLNK